jgi:hypothetical protein
VLSPVTPVQLADANRRALKAEARAMSLSGKLVSEKIAAEALISEVNSLKEATAAMDTRFAQKVAVYALTKTLCETCTNVCVCSVHMCACVESVWHTAANLNAIRYVSISVHA